MLINFFKNLFSKEEKPRSLNGHDYLASQSRKEKEKQQEKQHKTPQLVDPPYFGGHLKQKNKNDEAHATSPTYQPTIYTSSDSGNGC